MHHVSRLLRSKPYLRRDLESTSIELNVNPPVFNHGELLHVQHVEEHPSWICQISAINANPCRVLRGESRRTQPHSKGEDSAKTQSD